MNSIKEKIKTFLRFLVESSKKIQAFHHFGLFVFMRFPRLKYRLKSLLKSNSCFVLTLPSKMRTARAKEIYQDIKIAMDADLGKAKK